MGRDNICLLRIIIKTNSIVPRHVSSRVLCSHLAGGNFNTTEERKMLKKNSIVKTSAKDFERIRSFLFLAFPLNFLLDLFPFSHLLCINFQEISSFFSLVFTCLECKESAFELFSISFHWWRLLVVLLVFLCLYFSFLLSLRWANFEEGKKYSDSDKEWTTQIVGITIRID